MMFYVVFYVVELCCLIYYFVKIVILIYVFKIKFHMF